MCDLAIFFPSTLAELGDISRDATAAPIHYLYNIRELHALILYASLAKNTEAMYKGTEPGGHAIVAITL